MFAYFCTVLAWIFIAMVFCSLFDSDIHDDGYARWVGPVLILTITWLAAITWLVIVYYNY